MRLCVYVPKDLMDAVPAENVAGWHMTLEGERTDETGTYTIVGLELDDDDERRGWHGHPGAQMKVAALLQSVGQEVGQPHSWLALPCDDD